MEAIMKIQNHPSILEASSILFDETTVPHRVVLRKLDDDYEPFVTHFENLKFENDVFVHDGFYSGHYFKTEKDAWDDFMLRRRGYGSY
jgi:hypothetical protein